MNIQEIELWFDELCQGIGESCNIHIFAGAALALEKLKPATKDIDLMFESNEERSIFEKTLEARGYENTWKSHEASVLSGWTLKAGGETHLYYPGPDPFRLTPSMIKRSSLRFPYIYAKVFVLAPEDLLLLKTYPRNIESDEAKYMRPDDVRDIEALLTMKPDWAKIRKEIDAQVRAIVDDPNILDKRPMLRVANRFHLALSHLKHCIDQSIPDQVIVWAKRRLKTLEQLNED